MLTILSMKKKRRKSSFASSYSEDSSWRLTDRMSAKAKVKKMSVEELLEKTKRDYEEMEEIDFELEDEENGEENDQV